MKLDFFDDYLYPNRDNNNDSISTDLENFIKITP